MQGEENIIVGLDIGTTKICAVVGELVDGSINIIGMGSHPSIGLRKGAVVNIDSTVESIKKAVQEAEFMAGCEISSVYVGIAGGHIKGFNSHGIIAIKGGEITQLDIDRVIEAASAVAIPMDRETIHIIPQEFIVDDQESIQNPLGMTGVRLETKIHIVTGAVSSARNIIKCCNMANLEVCDIVLESLASGEAVLNREEKDLGCALADIGGGTTDLALFKGNHIKHTFELTLGGHNMTNDLSIGLRTPLAEAEKIKLAHGTCIASHIKPGETIEVKTVGAKESKTVARSIMAEILEPRVEEMFSILKSEIYSNGLENSFPSGIVLTGGSSMLDGIAEVVESVFAVPVRIGQPENIGGLKDVVKNPAFATGVGLVIYGSKNSSTIPLKKDNSVSFSKLLERMKQWFKDIL
ncbi:cell division protein FtsA [Desulfamplus magnetovallimortis]|uniref:cell division protein FtsA n=1 Tax=Desulfamplus magnetovallimortis TaxID=1246637 RepID=UPI0009BBA5B5|nr:cell division protein FtsA [Desulfamplus magnetovallimortis]